MIVEIKRSMDQKLYIKRQEHVMKKFLVGILVLGSFTAIAKDCDLVIKEAYNLPTESIAEIIREERLFDRVVIDSPERKNGNYFLEMITKDIIDNVRYVKHKGSVGFQEKIQVAYNLFEITEDNELKFLQSFSRSYPNKYDSEDPRYYKAKSKKSIDEMKKTIETKLPACSEL
jgi:hypothetical protein